MRDNEKIEEGWRREIGELEMKPNAVHMRMIEYVESLHRLLKDSPDLDVNAPLSEQGPEFKKMFKKAHSLPKDTSKEDKKLHREFLKKLPFFAHVIHKTIINKGIVIDCIERGADVNVKFDVGSDSPMPLLEVLVERHPYGEGDWLDKIRECNADIMEILLEYGADPNVESILHKACVTVAPFHHSSPLVKLLIDHGADVNAVCPHGLTPAIYTVAHFFPIPRSPNPNPMSMMGEDQMEKLKMLIAAGADIDYADGDSGKSARSIAYDSGDIDLKKKIDELCPPKE